MAEIMIWVYGSGFFASLIFLIILLGWSVVNVKDFDINIITIDNNIITNMIGISILSAFSWLIIILAISVIIFKYIKDRK